MTGFGAADGEVGGARVSVEIRSVNHRFFNPAIKLPSELSRWEPEVREALRRGVSRGHISVTARLARHDAEGTIDETRFGQYVDQIRRLQERFALDGVIDAATVLRLPHVVAVPSDETAGNAGELVKIVDRAMQALDAMRSAEGARLTGYVGARLSVIEQAVERIAARAPERLVEQRERLRHAVQELASGVTVDEQRLAQEIAILADKLDVSEEISRFHTHVAAFRTTLAAPPADGVGKRLGFLLQELLREANTTGSKANDAAIVQDVVLIKEELEKIREQAENLE
ncbi:MAG TPA: YicC/YloC family endoribonuclease [Gemmatimonadaceae bacterium]